jgi:hypothetical protein
MQYKRLPRVTVVRCEICCINYPPYDCFEYCSECGFKTYKLSNEDERPDMSHVQAMEMAEKGHKQRQRIKEIARRYKAFEDFYKIWCTRENKPYFSDKP